MSKVFCEQAVAPGIVVGLVNNSDISRSTWGITVPYAHWRANSKPDVLARFEDYSASSYPQIPCLEFTNAEEWKLHFDQFPQDVKPLCWLEDFLSGSTCAVPMTLWAASRRDGSRYYRELLQDLPYLARGSSKEFSKEELAQESPAFRSLYKHCEAIYRWKRENPDWKQWETVYVPGHKFHFTLFSPR